MTALFVKKFVESLKVPALDRGQAQRANRIEYNRITFYCHFFKIMGPLHQLEKNINNRTARIKWLKQCLKNVVWVIYQGVFTSSTRFTGSDSGGHWPFYLVHRSIPHEYPNVWREAHLPIWDVLRCISVQTRSGRKSTGYQRSISYIIWFLCLSEM